MRAAILRNRRIEVGDVPLPEPGPGEVLVKTLACGICGSDLHVFHRAQHDEDGGGAIVMGHEFVAEIVDYGPETTRRLKPGTRVTSIPILGRWPLSHRPHLFSRASVYAIVCGLTPLARYSSM